MDHPRHAYCRRARVGYAQRRMRWSGQNPVRLLDNGERPRSDQRKRPILTRDELERLLTAADERFRPIFVFAAGTGCRLGEVLGLKWRAIDFDNGTATITHQVDRRGREVELKTKRSRRTIELPTDLVAMLREQKLLHLQCTPDPLPMCSARAMGRRADCATSPVVLSVVRSIERGSTTTRGASQPCIRSGTASPRRGLRQAGTLSSCRRTSVTGTPAVTMNTFRPRVGEGGSQ